MAKGERMHCGDRHRGCRQQREADRPVEKIRSARGAGEAQREHDRLEREVDAPMRHGHKQDHRGAAGKHPGHRDEGEAKLA